MNVTNEDTSIEIARGLFVHLPVIFACNIMHGLSLFFTQLELYSKMGVHWYMHVF